MQCQSGLQSMAQCSASSIHGKLTPMRTPRANQGEQMFTKRNQTKTSKMTNGSQDRTKRDPEKQMDIKIQQKETRGACNGDTWGTEDLQGPQRNLSGRPDGTSRDTKEASAGKQMGPKTPKADQKRHQIVTTGKHKNRALTAARAQFSV